MKSFGALAVLTGLEAMLLASAPGQTPGRLPDVGEIIDRTVERAQWNESRDFEARFAHTLLTVTAKLDDQESIEEQREFLYWVVPVAGEPFRRLILKNGEPLSENERREEENRESRHRNDAAERARRAANGAHDNDDEDRLVLDRELVNRYRFELLGLRKIDGRPTFVVRFAPRAEDLPVRRRIDPLLNGLAGTVWIDRDEHEIVRVEATTQTEVKKWAGILGSVRHFSFELERTEVETGVWMPCTLVLHVHMRMLFRTTHVKETVSWSDFVRVEYATRNSPQ